MEQGDTNFKLVVYIIGGLFGLFILRRMMFMGGFGFIFTDAVYLFGPYFYFIIGFFTLVLAFFPKKNAYYLLFVLLYGGYQALFGVNYSVSTVSAPYYGSPDTSIRAYSASKVYVPPTPTTYSSSGSYNYSSSSSSSSSSSTYSSSSSSSSSSRSHYGGGLSGGK